MNIGDKVLYTKDGLKYLGFIVGMNSDASVYIVNIFAFRKSVQSDGSDIEKLD